MEKNVSELEQTIVDLEVDMRQKQRSILVLPNILIGKAYGAAF